MLYAELAVAFALHTVLVAQFEKDCVAGFNLPTLQTFNEALESIIATLEYYECVSVS